MATLPVRLATPADAEAVVRLGRLMFEAMGVPGDTSWHAPALAVTRAGLRDGWLAAFVVDEPGSARVVSGAAVGVSQRLPGPFDPTGRTGYVQYVCTEAGYRRRGLGRAVMSALVEWCRDNGVRSVELHATADGDALYRSLGFGEPHRPNLRLSL